MSIRAMQTAASGMAGYMMGLDTVANNLANAGTTAFKRSQVHFEDQFYQYYKLPGAQDSIGKLTPVGIHVGLGSRVAATGTDHSQGSLVTSPNDLHMAIEGDGFFQVQNGSEILYTRSGLFTKNADGDVVLESANQGRLLEPALSIPQDAVEIVISADGNVSVRQAGSSNMSQIGQIQTVRFINPMGLIHRGENLFAQSDASGTPQIGPPGLDGRGLIRQRQLELSNVEPVVELVELIKTQRNFELTSQVVQAADQTLQLMANLRRF